ncbi:MAG: hypothetical protein NC078_04570 [Ruminococcus sp.]|nr:hypothetical protein [Ruminococcus sp.]
MIEVIKKICEESGCGAYGNGRVSLVPKGDRCEQELADGGRLARIGAVLRAGGYEREEDLLRELESAAGKIEKVSCKVNGVEIPGARVRLPGVLSERREDGYAEFEAECFIWVIENGGDEDV